MKKLRDNLKKEEIAGSKGYMKWYRAFDNEVRLFINERCLNANNEIVNKIFWKENRALICIGANEDNKWFYEKYKDYDAKFFVKSDVGALYSEYEIKEWYLVESGIEVILN